MRNLLQDAETLSKAIDDISPMIEHGWPVQPNLEQALRNLHEAMSCFHKDIGEEAFREYLARPKPAVKS